MSVYVHVSHQDDSGAWGPGRLRYVPLAAVGDDDRAMLGRVSALPLEDWVTPFTTMDQPVAVHIGVKPSTQSLTCVAGFVEDAAAEIVQAEKPSAGYLTRQFLSCGKSYLHGANVDSSIARRRGFLPRAMHAFHALDRTLKTPVISISAINAGNYAWMSYGAIPSYRMEFNRRVREQWTVMADTARAKGLKPSPYLMNWVHDIARQDDAYFRAPFAADADPLMRASLKALLTGDLGFLSDFTHRFQNSMHTKIKYAEPFNSTLAMNPQDPHLHQHLTRRTALACKI